MNALKAPFRALRAPGAAGKRMVRRWSDQESRLFWDALHRSGVSAAVGLRYAGIGSIFMFHRVVPDVEATLKRELYVSTKFLEAWLASIRRAGTEVVSLDEMVRRIRDPDRGKGRRFVVVTFDDGYADNVTHALPVLARFGAPFAVYVTTDMVEHTGYPWWLGLERLFRESDAVDVPPMGRRFPAASFREKAVALAEVSAWASADRARRPQLLREVFDACGVSMGEVAAEAGMSREQLLALHRHPLATVGGHTTDHSKLTALAEPEALRGMRDNKTFLENVLEAPVGHFAYPFGACGEREAALARKAGFRTAVTTSRGCLFPEHSDHLLSLPRGAANGRKMWLSFMHAQRHGVRRFLESCGGSPVATL